MQSVYYIDNNLRKEDSLQYILSIRFATDGLSFCIHDINHKLMAFFHQPHTLDTANAVIARVKKMIVEDDLLNLKYKKTYIVSCNKEKTLVPAHIFNKNYISDIYRICLPTDKNDTILYRKIKIMEAYLVEALPRSFVTFLTNHYQSLCIVNSVYPFIIDSLSNTLLNQNHLFIDIQDKYFDLLLTQSNDVLLFNSFSYTSIPDLVYYITNCLKQCNINKDNLQCTFSGNLVNDPHLLGTLQSYIPNVSVLNTAALNQLVRNNDINSSSFVHLLNLHRCE